MSDDDTPYSDTPRVWCRHLLLCRNVWFDPARMDDGFLLGKLLVQVRPAEGESYPIVFHRLFAFVQLAGDVGTHLFRVRLLRIDRTGYDEEVEVPLGVNDEPLNFGPWEIDLVGEEYFESFAFPLLDIHLLTAGEYEFQLILDETPDAILYRERCYAYQ